MGVHTCSGEQVLAVGIELMAHFKRLFADSKAGAGEDHLHHAGLDGALDDGCLLVVKTAVGQVDADIDQLHGASSCRGAASIAKSAIIGKSPELQAVAAVIYCHLSPVARST